MVTTRGGSKVTASCPQGREYDKIRSLSRKVYGSGGSKAKTRGTRSKKANEKTLADLVSKAVSSAAVATPPQKQTKKAQRMTRSTSPRCTHFGIHRETMYPGYFFCGNCRQYEDIPPDMKARSNPNSQKNRCRAKHTSWVFPTEKLNSEPEHVTRKRTRLLYQKIVVAEQQTRMEEEDSDDNNLLEEEQNHDTNDTARDITISVSSPLVMQDTAPLAAVLAEDARRKSDVDFSVLRGQLDAAQAQLDAAQRQNRRLSKIVLAAKKRESAGCIDFRPPGGAKRQKSNIKQIVETIFAHTTEGEQGAQETEDSGARKELHDAVMQKARDEIRTKDYPAWAVLREMDLTGGAQSMTGVDILRKCETKGKKYFRGSILPCSATLKRAAARVNRAADTLLPFKTGRLEGEGGEFITFDPKDLLPLLIKAYKLDGVSKQKSVLIQLAIDGANISKHLTHVTLGLKVSDVMATCPITGRYMFGNAALIAQQSRNQCFPLKMCIARETNDIYRHFEEVFAYFGPDGDLQDDVVSKGMLGEGCRPLKIACNCDMSAQWKIKGRGGAAKNATYPCHCCAILSSDLAKENAVPCDRWCKQFYADDPTWKCYHREFLSEDFVDSSESELSDLQGRMSYGDEEFRRLDDESQIRTDENPNENARRLLSESDVESIFFKWDSPEVPDTVRNRYAKHITDDLRLRGLSPLGTLSERHRRLRESLLMEYTHKCLSQIVTHGQKGNKWAAVLLINLIPCILHLENRVGLKIVTRVLVKGLSYALEGKTFAELQGCNQRVLAFLQAVENIGNEDTWGCPMNPTQWKCPYDPVKKEIGILCLDNVKTRKAIDNIDKLIDVCIPEDEGIQEAWKVCVQNYRTAMVRLRQKTDFSDDDIIETQKSCDRFFQQWVELEGIEGVTNYIHMMGAGHLASYLFHWRNLYVHSQQGWEAFNALIKTFYFRRTARGGAGNAGKSEKTRLIPIAKWMQRRVIWMLGYTMEDIDAILKKEDEEEQEAADDDEESADHDDDDGNQPQIDDDDANEPPTSPPDDDDDDYDYDDGLYAVL